MHGSILPTVKLASEAISRGPEHTHHTHLHSPRTGTLGNELKKEEVSGGEAQGLPAALYGPRTRVRAQKRERAMIDHNCLNKKRDTFVWSKLRKRFHTPLCRWVLKILPANWRAGDTPEPLDG